MIVRSFYSLWDGKSPVVRFAGVSPFYSGATWALLASHISSLLLPPPLHFVNFVPLGTPSCRGRHSPFPTFRFPTFGRLPVAFHLPVAFRSARMYIWINFSRSGLQASLYSAHLLKVLVHPTSTSLRPLKGDSAISV